MHNTQSKRIRPVAKTRHPGGFTLVELLIVVIILGLLAAIVIPQFSSASTEARENMLRENLRILRLQIGCYQAQHSDVPPGYPNGDTSAAPTAESFEDQFIGFTNAQGGTNATRSAEYCYGPYMSRMPENPVNQSATIAVMNDGGAAPGGNGYGWFFWPGEHVLQAGCSGTDSQGRAYSTY